MPCRNALGAEVTVFSRQKHKLADPKKIGAAHAVQAISENFVEPYALEFDLIIATADVTGKFPLDASIKCVSRRRIHIPLSLTSSVSRAMLAFPVTPRP
jgi:D-arabinose 1-dehydrogenase-like Zn-dependent alcohol dehydrogenase